MEGDSAPLLDSAATPRWRRWSSLVCLSLLGLGCLALAAAVTLGYFLVIKKDAVGELVMFYINCNLDHFKNSLRIFAK